jgi:hypothetical protein
MALPVNPVELTDANQRYEAPCRIIAVVWVGTTTAGDTAEIRHQSPIRTIWKGQATDTNSYMGINLGPFGMHAPSGFSCFSITAGTKILVYLAEG